MSPTHQGRKIWERDGLVLLLALLVVCSEEAMIPRERCLIALLKADEDEDNRINMTEYLSTLTYLSNDPYCPSIPVQDELSKIKGGSSPGPFVESFYSLSCLCSVVSNHSRDPLCCPKGPDETTTVAMPLTSYPYAYLGVFCKIMVDLIEKHCGPEAAAAKITDEAHTTQPSPLTNDTIFDPNNSQSVPSGNQNLSSSMHNNGTVSPTDGTSLNASMATTTTTSSELEHRGNIDNGVTLLVSVLATCVCFVLCLLALWRRYSNYGNAPKTAEKPPTKCCDDADVEMTGTAGETSPSVSSESANTSSQMVTRSLGHGCVSDF